MIQFLRGSKSQLESSSTIIAAGQPVFESDTGQLKIGTGSSRYSSLPYVGSIFEYDPDSGGGSSTNVAYSGDINNGYIDFPGGLRYSWGKADNENYYDFGTEEIGTSGTYTSDSTMSWSLIMSGAGASPNWKSVVIDGILTIESSYNLMSWMMAAESDVETAFGAIKAAFESTSHSHDLVFRWHVWSHD